MSISSEELDQAYENLHSTWQKAGARNDWDDVKLLSQHGTRFLRITRWLEHEGTQQKNVIQEDGQPDEDDEEALRPLKIASTRQHVVAYDIVHSPSYQVPVLYLNIQSLAAGHRPTIDELYKLLVPTAYKPQMQAVGVLGALSLTEHPVYGLPTYFVHPCRTREVMELLLSCNEAKPEQYLLLWIGLMGASVGLSMPVELASELKDTFGERLDSGVRVLDRS